MHNTTPLTPCESSNIKAFGQDPSGQVLAVQFKDEAQVHQFANNVDAELADKFLKADSKGQAFHAHIRGREFTKADAELAEEIYEGSTPD